MKHTLPILIARLLAPCAFLRAADSSKPNIVLVMANDLGYGDPRVLGQGDAFDNYPSLKNIGAVPDSESGTPAKKAKKNNKQGAGL